jgi:hypothetical protein
MSSATIESWLLNHKDTLTHIKIGSVSDHRHNRPFNATLFPNLEYLQVSQWDMYHSVSKGFASEHWNLLGPKLKTFAWDFADTEWDTKGLSGFGDPEALWLRAFVEAAIARKVPLNTVKIYYESYDWDCATYPWDRMDEIRYGVMRPYGLDLIYNEPTMHKEVWLRSKEDPKATIRVPLHEQVSMTVERQPPVPMMKKSSTGTTIWRNSSLKPDTMARIS